MDKERSGTIAQLVFIGIVAPLVVWWLIRVISGDPPPPPTPTPPTTAGTGEVAASTLPAGPVGISFFSSSTKEDWINTVTADFNSRQFTTSSGRPIVVTVEHGNSGDPQEAILAGELTPTMWSPGEQSWATVADEEWQVRYNESLFADECVPTVNAPIGFGMWRPMAEALGWPDQPVSWETIVSLAADPQGWASYGHPEWGQFKFGHTHPDHSNSGILIMTALVYDALGQTADLTYEMAKSEPVVEAMQAVEEITYHYGIQSANLVLKMIERGPSYLHAINVTEAELLRHNELYRDEMEFPLAFIFPAGGTFWANHPLCILAGDWVSSEQQEAARIYRDFLLAPEQQAKTLDYYVRPIIGGIPLHAPFTLENGTDPRVTTATVPALPSPPSEVTDAIKDVFHQVKKKATIAIVLDTSASMGGEKLKQARDATAEFVANLAQDDDITVYVFNSEVVELQPAGRAAETKEVLGQNILNLFSQGDTVLYDAVCQAVQDVEAMRVADEASGNHRLYGVVVLSDGQDTSSQLTQNDMINCLPTGEDVEGIKVFTIAYGADADHLVLLHVANQTNGKKFDSGPDTIEEVYTQISAEQ